MLAYWTSKSSIRSVANDTRTLSLHVMSSAGFGKSYRYQGSDEPSSTGGPTSYKDALKLILDNLIPLFVLGPKNLSKWWLPKRWKLIYQATLTFQNYMTRIYEEEKQAMLHGRSSSNNLVTSLIRASQEMAEAADADTVNEKGAMPRHKQGGLTEDEIYGNIFVFNFAGHDTTAHTLAFGIVLLATRPDVQDWIAEEVHYMLGDQEAENWCYSEAFPKLKRCLAVLVRSTDICIPCNRKPITFPTHSTKRCASITRSPS
jgi:Cytochrome P450